MRIDAYEGKIKRLVYADDNGTLTFEQLCFAFERSQNWSDLKNPRSRLYKLFHHPLLYDEKQPSLLNVHRCILLGLVLCNGEDKLKARVLYDVLQDGMQQSISAGDKDFLLTITRLIEVSVYLTTLFYVEMENSCDYLNLLPKVGTSKFTRAVEEFLEEYQDLVYQTSDSRVSRSNLILRTAQNASYVLNSERIRVKWLIHCEAVDKK